MKQTLVFIWLVFGNARTKDYFFGLEPKFTLTIWSNN